MAVTFKPDPDSVKVNWQAKYVDQSSFTSKAIVQTHRHTPG